MKITETDKGNIKIVMSKEHASALHDLLDEMSYDTYENFLGINNNSADLILNLWSSLKDHQHIL